METYLRLAGTEYLSATDILYYLESIYCFDKENKMDICHTLLDVDKMFKDFINKESSRKNKSKNLK